MSTKRHCSDTNLTFSTTKWCGWSAVDGDECRFRLSVEKSMQINVNRSTSSLPKLYCNIFFNLHPIRLRVLSNHSTPITGQSLKMVRGNNAELVDGCEAT